jgi:hypothetical protein
LWAGRRFGLGVTAAAAGFTGAADGWNLNDPSEVPQPAEIAIAMAPVAIPAMRTRPPWHPVEMSSGKRACWCNERNSGASGALLKKGLSRRIGVTLPSVRGKRLLAVALLGLVVGCGSSGSGTAAPVQLGTDIPSDSPFPTVTDTAVPGQIPPDEPTTDATLPPPPAVPVITGYGAAVDAWNGAHSADPNFNPGSAYDPDPSLARDGDIQHDDKYYAVNPLGGFITDYSERFATGTTIAAARAAVLAEFPTDATTIWVAVKDSCAQEVVQSPTVGAALAAQGDPKGWALVEFSSGPASDHYDSSDISEALYLPADSSDSTPDEALGC